MGLIGKVERRIKAVEKDVQKINKKLPNFLTRHYTVRNAPIRLENHSEMAGDWLYDEWKFKAELEPVESWDNYYFRGYVNDIDCGFVAIGPYDPPQDGFLLYFEGNSGPFPIYFSSVNGSYSGYDIPAGWSAYDANEDAYIPLSEPPTFQIYEWWEDYIFEMLDAQATFVKSEYEKYENKSYMHLEGYELNFGAEDKNPSNEPYQAEIYSNGRGMFMESTRQSDGEQSQIGVGPWGVKMSAYGNTVLEFGNNGNRITGLDDPDNDTDAANKLYVDGKLTLDNGVFMQNGVDVTADVKAALGIE